MIVVVIVVLVLAAVLGAIYLLFLRGKDSDAPRYGNLAQVGCWCGIAAVALTVLAAVLSFTTILDALPFRNALGIIAFLGGPAALAGVGCSLFGLKSELKAQAWTGLALSAGTIISWAAMVALAG